MGYQWPFQVQAEAPPKETGLTNKNWGLMQVIADRLIRNITIADYS